MDWTIERLICPLQGVIPGPLWDSWEKNQAYSYSNIAMITWTM